MCSEQEEHWKNVKHKRTINHHSPVAGDTLSAAIGRGAGVCVGKSSISGLISLAKESTRRLTSGCSVLMPGRERGLDRGW